MSGQKSRYEIELTESQFAYLGEIAERFGLPDQSKAVRCLVNYVREEAAREEDIFGEIRCQDC